VKWLVLVVALAACQGKREAPESTYGSLDYTREGVPALDHAWTPEEHVAAASAIAKLADGHVERLPRFGKGRSGAVFDHMIAIGPFDDALSIEARLGQHADRFQAAIDLSKLYNKDGMQLPNTEWIELIAVALHEASSISQLVDPYFESLPADDPSRDARLAGVAKMRAGWSGMMQGGLLVAANNLVPEHDRVRMLEAIEDAMPVLYPLLPTADQAGIRDLATKLVTGTSGAIHDEASRIEKLATPPQ
jgi:hypothetical protein